MPATADVISDAVWLYFRFPLSLRMVEKMLAVRGIVVSPETTGAHVRPEDCHRHLPARPGVRPAPRRARPHRRHGPHRPYALHTKALLHCCREAPQLSGNTGIGLRPVPALACSTHVALNFRVPADFKRDFKIAVATHGVPQSEESRLVSWMQEQVYQKPGPRVRRRSRRVSVVMNSVEPFSPQPRLVVIAPTRMVPRRVPSAARTKTASRPAA